MLRFGGPVFLESKNEKGETVFDPEVLVAKYKEKGYTAASCPKLDIKDEYLIKTTREIFQRENVMLGEASFWGNLMDTDEATRKANREKQIETFYLGDMLGAKVCVNIFGSYCHGSGGPTHNEKNFSEDAFAEAVDMARYFIDTVKPQHTSFAFEMYAFDLTYSIDNMERLIKAVDRDKFGVHFDHANLICDGQKYFNNGLVAKEMLHRLGHKIVGGHVKDILLKEPSNSIMLEEVVAGRGNVDFQAFLGGVHKLPQEVPMLMEHLTREEEYDTAHAFIRKQLEIIGVSI